MHLKAPSARQYPSYGDCLEVKREYYQNCSVLALPSARQHPSYGDCLEVKREYYQYSSVLDCVTQCSQSAAHLHEQFLQVQQIGCFDTVGWVTWPVKISSPNDLYCVEWDVKPYSTQLNFNRLDLSHWDPYAVRRGGYLELCYCNMVEWFWWDSSLISTTNWFPSVLWHCWFGHLVCKNRPQNDLMSCRVLLMHLWGEQLCMYVLYIGWANNEHH